MKKEQTFKH